jgi:hypothetical protein
MAHAPSCPNPTSSPPLTKKTAPSRRHFVTSGHRDDKRRSSMAARIWWETQVSLPCSRRHHPLPLFPPLPPPSPAPAVAAPAAAAAYGGRSGRLRAGSQATEAGFRASVAGFPPRRRRPSLRVFAAGTVALRRISRRGDALTSWCASGSYVHQAALLLCFKREQTLTKP